MKKWFGIVLVLVGINCYGQVNSNDTKKTNPKKPTPQKYIPKKTVPIKSLKSESHYTNSGLGIGVTRSVIFLSRNVKEFNDANGLHLTYVYDGHKLMRFAAEFSQYKSIDIEPTWYDIKARTYEANVQFLAHFRSDKALIYPITGLSVNEFTGFFTGKDDFQNLRDRYQVNTTVKSYWIGANFGVGYEYAFGPVKAYLIYKMRVGAQDVNERLNIMDVCYHIGLRYDFETIKYKYAFRKIFRNYKGRYTYIES